MTRGRQSGGINVGKDSKIGGHPASYYGLLLLFYYLARLPPQITRAGKALKDYLESPVVVVPMGPIQGIRLPPLA